ncbi:MAG: MetQ/NlpA family ABC transporter substrate-binding protein [Treponema sp.]|nr:MetQ/NlpA family ABC transporter substrate-binding protein [Treponema sp.]
MDKKLFIFLIFISLMTACQERQIIYKPVVSDYELVKEEEKKDLKVGVVAGPYGDMFMDAIMPSLERMGYTASLVHYNDFISPNLALAQNEIDLNIFQHYAYLNSFKFEHDLALSAISEIPTISMGIYSRRYNSLDELSTGISVSIPDDSTNLARALRVLESADIIRLNPYIDKSKAEISDIISNPRRIRIVLIEAHNLVSTLNRYDVSVINGNFAISNGLNPSDALYNEVLAENYINVIAVRTEDLRSQFVRDIIDVLHSNEYKEMIINPVGKYIDFQYPRSFLDRVITQVN